MVAWSVKPSTPVYYRGKPSWGGPIKRPNGQTFVGERMTEHMRNEWHSLSSFTAKISNTAAALDAAGVGSGDPARSHAERSRRLGVVRQALVGLWSNSSYAYAMATAKPDNWWAPLSAQAGFDPLNTSCLINNTVWATSTLLLTPY